MDRHIRQVIENRMDEQGISNSDLSRTMGVSRQAIGQLINGQRGTIPDSLIDLLDALGLELVVQAKRSKKN